MGGVRWLPFFSILDGVGKAKRMPHTAVLITRGGDVEVLPTLPNGTLYRRPVLQPVKWWDDDHRDRVSHSTRDFIRGAVCLLDGTPAFVEVGAKLLEARMVLLITSRTDKSRAESALRRGLYAFVDEAHRGWCSMGFEIRDSQDAAQRAASITCLEGRLIALVGT